VENKCSSPRLGSMSDGESFSSLSMSVSLITEFENGDGTAKCSTAHRACHCVYTN
jgi:hypothetical protein